MKAERIVGWAETFERGAEALFQCWAEVLIGAGRK